MSVFLRYIHDPGITTHSLLVCASLFIRLSSLLKYGPLNNTLCVCVSRWGVCLSPHANYNTLFKPFWYLAFFAWHRIETKGAGGSSWTRLLSSYRLRCDKESALAVSVSQMLRPMLRPVSHFHPQMKFLRYRCSLFKHTHTNKIKVICYSTTKGVLSISLLRLVYNNPNSSPPASVSAA